ncbi:MAG: glycosyl transferase [Verrucomicrobiaceae bacterium]|nr:glycosyl transferase [Verrucomicrobiaceae bacterium]
MSRPAHAPLITVVISNYNHATYIEASIRSVLEQTYENIELLVYDDGSRDDSVAIIQKLADEYGFFFQAQSNRGLSQTLNDAIKRASGEFFAPFGSDDIMLSDRFEKQVPWIIARPMVGIAAGNVIKIDARGEALSAKRQRKRSERLLDFNHLFLDDKTVPVAATLLFRTAALQQIGGFNEEIRLEDLYVELKIMEAGWKLGAMEDVLAYYREHPTNTIKNLRFMHDAVLKTYACFAQHPGYEKVVGRWINHSFLRASNRDKVFAKECLKQLPLRYWNLKTLRGIWRLLTA